MSSLRTRIAAVYAALIVLVLALGAVAIDFTLKSELIDQTKLNLAETSDSSERNAVEATTFGFAGPGSLPLVLSNRATLDHFAAANQYIQIDTTGGQILGKSTNLGGLAFPPFEPPRGTDRSYEELPVVGDRPGTMLVLNRVLLDAAERPIAIAHVAERLDIVAQLIARAHGSAARDDRRDDRHRDRVVLHRGVGDRSHRAAHAHRRRDRLRAPRPAAALEAQG